jgi:hypothetical protein
MPVKYIIPIKTVAGLNAREHHMVRARRIKSERYATSLIVKPHHVPCIVRMVRISPSLCDDDNLQGALKSVRDEIAKICGADDGPNDPITWAYGQEKCKRGHFGVRVEILAI